MLYPTLWRSSAAPSAWDELSTARREVDRVFDRFFGQGAAQGMTVWAPAVDVRETDDELLVTAELPGMAPEDVHVTVENGVLTIALPKAEAAKPKKVQIEVNGKSR